MVRYLLIAAGLAAAAPPVVAQPLAAPFQTVFDGTGLAGVGALAATPDGRHLYAAGIADLAITALSRNAASGRLGRIAIYREGAGGFSGIAPAARLALGVDGRILYAAGVDRVTALERDPESGQLGPGPTLRGGFGINQIADLAIAADGTRLFATGSSAVAMFAADSDGQLEHLTTVADGPAHAGLGGATSIDVAGDHVYVGSDLDRSISVLRIDGVALVAVQTLTAEESPLLGAVADLVVSGDGEHLYAALPADDRVVVLARDPDDGRLTVLGAAVEAPPGRGLAAPSRLLLSSDGRRLYVASAAHSTVALLERDPGSGGLTPVRSVADDVGGVLGIGGSADLALGPAQTHVYVSGPTDGAIGLFDAALSFLAVERNSAGAISGLRQPAAVVVAPDGAHLYAAGFGAGAVAIFRRNDGVLEFAGSYRGEGERRLQQPISLAFSNDATVLAVADFGAGAVHTLRRDPVSGALQPLSILDGDTVADLRGVAAIALAPGADVAAATSLLSGSVVLLNVHPETAALSLRATMPALAQPSSAVFSGDGDNLYVTSSGSGAVVVFETTAAGPFAQTQVVRDSDAEVTGLISPASLAVTDGNLYAASGAGIFQLDGSNAVTVFAREAPAGRLRFRAALVDQVGGVAGIRGATAVAVAPHGDLVAAAGFTGNSIALFERNAAGDLTFAEAHFDGTAGADGLGGAGAVAFSPGGAELYVAGFADNALTAFRLPTPPPTATPTATPTLMPSATATAPPTATEPAASPTASDCAGDCDGDDTTGIAELIRCVNVALGATAVEACPACDADDSGDVAINELIRAVNAALRGCA